MEPSTASRGGPFGALHHVGIIVEDLDAVCDRLTTLLNGHVADEGVDDPLGARWLWIESVGSPIVELVAPIGNGPIAEYFARRGEGLHHLSFLSASLEDSLAHVHRCGLGAIGENRNHSGYEEFFVDPSATGRALFHCFRALAA